MHYRLHYLQGEYVVNRRFSLIIRYCILMLVLAALGFGAYALFANRDTTVYNEPPPAVVLAKPFTGTLEKSLTVSGTIEAEALIPVFPFVSGTIQSYPLKEGDLIEEGETIALIDPQAYRQQLVQAQAAYTVAQSTFDRIQRLYEAKATTQQNYEQALAQRDASKAQWELAQLQLDYATVKAPVAGTVIQAPTAVGNVASNQQPLLVIANLDNLVVNLDVPERYYDIIEKYKTDLSALVKRSAFTGLTGPGESELIVSEASVETIGSYIQPQSKTFTVRCKLLENQHDFKPGMHVQVRLVYQSILDVPLLWQKDRTIDGNAYIYDSDSEQVRWIALETVDENDEVFIVPDAYRNMLFVVEGQHRILDGQRVTVAGRRKE